MQKKVWIVKRIGADRPTITYMHGLYTIFPSQEAADAFTKRYREDDFFEEIVEGELLEGGTVEKWCCGINEICNCKCHNKKEEKTCVCPSCQAGHKNGHNVRLNFNRETPKLPATIFGKPDIWELKDKLNELIDFLKAKNL